jgi:hypothetical protein
VLHNVDCKDGIDIEYGSGDLFICPDIGCEYDCEMRGNKPTCFCMKGFKLAPNEKSCIKIVCQNECQFTEKNEG